VSASDPTPAVALESTLGGGDLTRLAHWWFERRPSSQRVVSWLTGTIDPMSVVDQVDKAIDSGVSLIAIAASGDEIPARSLIAIKAGIGAAEATAHRLHLSDLQWMRTVAQIRDQRAKNEPDLHLTALSAVFSRCSERKTPVLFDGVIAHAAAVQAFAASDQEHPANYWWLPASTSTDPAITTATRHLDLTAALNLLGDGTGDLAVRAVLAVLDVLDDGEVLDQSAVDALP